MDTLMYFIGFAIFGLIIGAIARLLMPGRQEMSLALTMVLGVVGSLLGGLVSWAIFGGAEDRFAPAGWIMSIIGAIIVLWIYGAAMTRRRSV